MKDLAIINKIVVCAALCMAGEASAQNAPKTYAFTTLAGHPGGAGSADGSPANARFYWPGAVAADAIGNVYVADTGNSTIRRIAPDGTVTTLAGAARQFGATDGAGPSARFVNPGGIAVDAAGNVYVADSGNNTIRKIASDGNVSTFAGTAGQSGSADGVGLSALFSSPEGLAVDAATNIYVADSGNGTIRKISPDGTVRTLAGAAGTPGSSDGKGTNAMFNYPFSLAVDASGNIYVADTLNFTVRKITPDGMVSTFAGLLGKPGTVDGMRGDARFAGPAGVAADTNGNLYVTDAGTTIRKVTPAGMVTTFAGMAGHAGSLDAVGTNASFNGAAGPAVDREGNVYVADRGNNTIRKIASDGTVSSLAGMSGQAGATDGVGPAARFNTPWGVAVDVAGNVYVADEGNFTLRQITPAGLVTTIGGMARNSQGAIDGISTNAGFGGARWDRC